MLDAELFRNARWQDLYNFFANGSPPLILELLVINTIFLILFIVRQATSKHPMRYSTAYIMQGLLLAANAFFMFQHDIMTMVSHLRRMI